MGERPRRVHIEVIELDPAALPVVRQAVIASSFGLRFQGQGYLLADARTHHGTSGAPVVMHDDARDPQWPWKLLGVHSAGMEMGGRGWPAEQSLGLNCAWYADTLLTLTAKDTLDTHLQSLERQRSMP